MNTDYCNRSDYEKAVDIRIMDLKTTDRFGAVKKAVVHVSHGL
jgi:hypothetical protein